MKKEYREYLIELLVATLLQLLLFNNINIGPIFAPMVYFLPIMLLPMQSKQLVVFGVALTSGLLMDWLTGSAGLYTLSAMPMAMLRPLLLTILCSKEHMAQSGAPSIQTMGQGTFFRYTIFFVALHNAIYFTFDTLSFTNLGFTLARYAVSSVASIIFVAILTLLLTRTPARHDPR